MKTLGETITGFVVLIVTGNASAAITITKIADTNTAIPNGSGNFTGFGAVSLDGQDVAFRGLGGSGQDGEYLFDQGVLNRIADTSTAIPNGVGNFMNFSPISLDSGNFAFVVGENNQKGIYTNLGGSLRKVVDRNTAIPSGTGNFTGGRSTVPRRRYCGLLGNRHQLPGRHLYRNSECSHTSSGHKHGDTGWHWKIYDIPGVPGIV